MNKVTIQPGGTPAPWDGKNWYAAGVVVSHNCRLYEAQTGVSNQLFEPGVNNGDHKGDRIAQYGPDRDRYVWHDIGPVVSDVAATPVDAAPAQPFMMNYRYSQGDRVIHDGALWECLFRPSRTAAARAADYGVDAKWGVPGRTYSNGTVDQTLWKRIEGVTVKPAEAAQPMPVKRVLEIGSGARDGTTIVYEDGKAVAIFLSGRDDAKTFVRAANPLPIVGVDLAGGPDQTVISVGGVVLGSVGSATIAAGFIGDGKVKTRKIKVPSEPDWIPFTATATSVNPVPGKRVHWRIQCNPDSEAREAKNSDVLCWTTDAGEAQIIAYRVVGDAVITPRTVADGEKLQESTMPGNSPFTTTPLRPLPGESFPDYWKRQGKADGLSDEQIESMMPLSEAVAGLSEQAGDGLISGVIGALLGDIFGGADDDPCADEYCGPCLLKRRFFPNGPGGKLKKKDRKYVKMATEAMKRTVPGKDIDKRANWVVANIIIAARDGREGTAVSMKMEGDPDAERDAKVKAAVDMKLAGFIDVQQIG